MTRSAAARRTPGDQRSAWRDLGWPLLAFLAASVPFLGKPFHLDDPLYLWAAKQIQRHPFDFYGFTVNWNGLVEPMVDTMINPPLASYYLAAFGSLFGWSELGIHLWMLLPAVAVIIGTGALARELGVPARPAAVLTALSPAFFVSSTTVMCDVLMVAGFVWSVVFWLRGLRTRRPAAFAAGALLVAASALSKYFGVALIPLLAVYTVARERRVVPELAWLLLPVGLLGAYEALSLQLYGTGLLQGAARYPMMVRAAKGWAAWPSLVTMLAFTGGCFLNVALFTLRPWSWRRLVVGLGLAALVMVVLLAAGGIGEFPLKSGGRNRWWVAPQVAVLAVLGLAALWAAARELVTARDPATLLLVLWVLGTGVFSARVNWSVNVRSLLPMGPALAILLARRLGEAAPRGGPAWSWARSWPIAVGAAVALLVGAADHRLATTSRDAAVELARELRPRAKTVWFQGHWGFQYYAEESGLVPVDFTRSVIRPGDLMVVPESNHNLTPLPAAAIEVTGTRSWPSFPGLSTMNAYTGAGFYADRWGPLPYALGPVVPDFYAIVSVVRLMEP